MNAFTVFALPLQLLTGLVVAIGATYLVFSLYRERRTRALIVAAAIGGWLAAYAAIVMIISLSSAGRVLELDEPKRFCGFYLDCHAIVTVRAVTRTPTLGEGDHQIRAAGEFYVVTLEQSSDADNVPIGLAKPEAVVIDAEGQRYARSPTGEAALARVYGEQPPLGRAVRTGEAYATRLVFDLPADIRDPKLHVSERDLLARLSELFLIGDEDSLFHRPTLFRLAS